MSATQLPNETLEGLRLSIQWELQDYSDHNNSESGHHNIVYAEKRLMDAFTAWRDAHTRAVRLARIDERERISHEIDDVVTRHASNRDLSPIAELRDYMRDGLASLKKEDNHG